MKYFIILNFLMFPLFINAYSFNVLKVDTNLEKVNQLKICLNNQDRICFFQEFPKTFNEFEILYGYSDSTGGAVFYNDYPEHLNFLFSDIDSDIDFRKIIEICLEGKWDADAVNMFQSKTRDLLLNYNRVFLSSLFKFNKKEQESFWYFIFDGPHRNSYGNRVFHEALLNQTKVFYPEKVEGIRNKIKMMILTEEKD